MARNGSSSRNVVAASAAAIGSTMAALSCCLPLGPFLLAAGSAGASAVFVWLQPYLIGLSVLLLMGGTVQAFRARQCGRRRRIWNLAVLCLAAAMITVMLFAHVPARAPAGQPPVAAFQADSFRQIFNAAENRTRVVVLLSPT